MKRWLTPLLVLALVAGNGAAGWYLLTEGDGSGDLAGTNEDVVAFVAGAVEGYCLQPVALRLTLRRMVARAVAPHELAINCRQVAAEPPEPPEANRP